ncbi:Hint domain-containing protein [uncultured Paracoccus sp.]|uniref:Hint domain-containing protein n=1 Tax=uncultured Paracoccus sp. TaxID=189685 RepID=UPI00262C6D70|nr:Hint domain-containing protein [uncultured Paracoccus sp.]
MPLVTFDVYRTTIVNGSAGANSVIVQLTVNDANSDGRIDTIEWGAYTGINNYGHIAGDTGISALFRSTAANGNLQNGYLYTSVPFAAGTNMAPVLSQLDRGRGGPPDYQYSVSIDALSICFVSGTLIATPDGDRPVESLRPGDLVLTRDHGPQPLVWTGLSAVDADRLDRNPNLRPVRIAAGALGERLPRRDLCVSPQHRILVRDADGREYLAAALHLWRAGLPGVTLQADGLPFDLVHIACDRHEIILAEGAATESLFTGPMAIRALSAGDRSDLIRAFPALASGENPMTPARPFLNRKEVAALVEETQRVTA